MENQKDKSQADRDWENRTLCIDESCIGVIGSDGRCKECGLPSESKQPEDIPAARDRSEAKIEAEIEEEIEEEIEAESTEDSESESQNDIDWENRTLCIDESCIGVIGSDGRCKECGLPFKDE